MWLIILDSHIWTGKSTYDDAAQSFAVEKVREKRVKMLPAEGHPRQEGEEENIFDTPSRPRLCSCGKKVLFCYFGLKKGIQAASPSTPLPPPKKKWGETPLCGEHSFPSLFSFKKIINSRTPSPPFPFFFRLKRLEMHFPHNTSLRGKGGVSALFFLLSSLSKGSPTPLPPTF